MGECGRRGVILRDSFPRLIRRAMRGWLGARRGGWLGARCGGWLGAHDRTQSLARRRQLGSLLA